MPASAPQSEVSSPGISPVVSFHQCRGNIHRHAPCSPFSISIDVAEHTWRPRRLQTSRDDTMSRTAPKVAISALVIAGSLGYLLYSSMSDNLEFYKRVDEVLADQETWIGVQMRLAGKVGEGSIFNKPGTHDYVFRLIHSGESMPIRYSGTVPDSFTENAEVVVTGRLQQEGYFAAERLFAKCPSKYEAMEDERHPSHVTKGAGQRKAPHSSSSPEHSTVSIEEEPGKDGEGRHDAELKHDEHDLGQSLRKARFESSSRGSRSTSD